MCKFSNLKPVECGSCEVRSAGRTHGGAEEDEAPTNQVAVPSNEHVLAHCYWMWHSRRPPRDVSTATDDDQALRMVGRVASVEQWWGLYSHLARPNELPPLSDLHLFKLGIKPMWEDPANVNGGKWVVRLRKSVTPCAWEDLCMAMLGEQLMVGPELCGVVLSVRVEEDCLEVWHRNSSNFDAATRVRDAFRRVLQLPASVPIKYKSHGLRASSSRQPSTDIPSR